MITIDALARCLLDPARAVPQDLTTWNGSDPAQRFAVYRNNVTVSLVDALAVTFPVTEALVGREFFRAMALVYVRKSPPRSRQMLRYGDTLADFIAQFEPAASLPYLADVARLERARVDALHASDAVPLDRGTLAGLLADPGRLDQACLVLHPSVRVQRSRYAIFSLWSAHQQPELPETLDPWRAESVLIWRRDDQVWLQRIPDAEAVCLQALQRGEPLGEALAQATDRDPDFDLTPLLTLLLREDLMTQPDGNP